jgi:nicotinamide riboside kinase
MARMAKPVAQGAMNKPKRGCLRIAIVGAESTGKSSLALALASALQAWPDLPAAQAWRVACVPEVLRGWCDRNGRTPLAHEQAAILRAQHMLIEEAAASHDIVVCDTTALMTAVYSRFVFNDGSLDARAIELQARMDLTLLMALDLPWVADGLQRDGPQVQEPVDALLRSLLQQARLPFEVIEGQGPARLANALAAVAPLLRPQPPSNAPARRGLFDRASAGRWSCSCCLCLPR